MRLRFSRSLAQAALVVVLAALAGPAAAGGTVHLNGVNIDGVVNQEFKNVKSVRIDAQGNVLIDAPAYKIEGAPAASAATPATAPASGPVTKRYFLVTDVPVPGKSDYDFDVFVNAKWIRKIKNEDEQVVMEVTPFLRAGQNKIVFRATKRGKRTSFSPEHYLAVVVGEGNMGGDQVMIDNPILEFKKHAAEVDSVDKEYTLNAR